MGVLLFPDGEKVLCELVGPPTWFFMSVSLSSSGVERPVYRPS